MSGSGSGRTGRRPGSADTRERILSAARAAFGERGFDGATIRGIAGQAGVDPALVHHYFGTKQRLFVAAMEFPVDLAAAVPRLVVGPPEDLGQRIVRFVLDLWDSPPVQPLVIGLIRSAATDPVAATMLRRMLTEGPFLAAATALGTPDAPVRAVLAGSQLIGLTMARYIVRVEPIASASPEDLARAVGPTIQRYLTADPDDLRPLASVAEGA